MYVTNVTVLRGGRGLTEVTPYDILEAVHRVLHGQACCYRCWKIKEEYLFNSVIKTFGIRKLHVAKFQLKDNMYWHCVPIFYTEYLHVTVKLIRVLFFTQKRKISMVFTSFTKNHLLLLIRTFYRWYRSTNLASIYHGDYRCLYFLVWLPAVESRDGFKCQGQLRPHTTINYVR